MRKLEWADLLTCARGFVRTEDREGALYFQRFDRQAQAWYDQREGWQIRTRCPAGVVLDFFSDAPSLTLRATIHKGARKACWFDLVADGLLAGTLGAGDPGETIEGTLPCGPAGHKRLQLYLSHNRPMGLLEVALPDGASFEPAAPRRSILFLGDSITQGMDAGHPALCYPMVAARRLRWDLFNAGVGGAVFAQESLPQAPVPAPEQIVIAYGTNDWNGARSLDEARAFLKKVRTHWPSTPVAVLEPLWRTAADGEGEKNAHGQTLEDYRAGLREIVAGFDGMRCLRYDALLPPGPAFLFDGTHPSEAGHIVYGENLARLLRAE